MAVLSPLDWVFVTVLACSLVLGAWRGLVYELLSAAGWVVSFVAAQWFAADVGALFPWGGDNATIRYAIGFLIVFVATLFGCGLVAWLAKKMVESVGLRPIDRALGAVFGMARGVLLLLVVAVVCGLTPMRQTALWQESLGAAWLEQALQILRPVLPEDFGRHLSSLETGA